MRLFFAALVVPVIAGATEPLTWEESVREALRNNVELSAGQESVYGARLQYKAAYTPFLPQLSASAGYSKSRVGSVAGEGQYSMGLSASQNLFSGWGDKARLDQAYSDLQAAQAGYQDIAARVGFELKSAFARLLYSQENLKLSEVIAVRRKDNVRLVELRYQAGREHKGSYLRSRASWRQAEFELSQARRTLRLAQRELARVVGRPQTEVLEAAGELKTELPQETPNFTALAFETPAYVQAKMRLRSAEAGVTAARSALFPGLSASASVSRSGAEWEPPGPTRWSTGLSLSFPFFTGGRNFINEASARSDRRRTESEFKNTEERTALDMEDSFAALQDAAERTAVQNEFLEAAQLRAEIGRSQYTSGLISFQDWDLIENDLISSQRSTLSSRRDAVVAEASWKRTQGKGISNE